MSAGKGLSTRVGASRYDFIKVRVHVRGHYYVLSRFLLSRQLNVTSVPAAVAVRVALSLKKHLVDAFVRAQHVVALLLRELVGD